ncbi:hypothetical protein KY290_038319 [Solanum tuberosum]|uniref:Retrotransposon gag domain-containing protein n=1 Tax=Solanum tuberosum TaxID=4113 RepID=A0ABQ7TY33_SOLTU|nr:hypothetical protein KY290_038319 [Solanum tuberosum]
MGQEIETCTLIGRGKDKIDNGELLVSTWGEMKRVTRKCFVPSHFKRDLQKRLQTLKQGSMFVDDYFKAMDMAMIQANCNEDEEATMERFLNDELVELAVKVEKQNKRKQQASSWKNRSTTTTRKSWPTHEEKSMPKSQDDKGKGKWEAKDGGKTFNTKISTPATPSNAIQCQKCQGSGHKAFECPNRRVVLINDNGEYESEKGEGKKKKRVLGVRMREMWLLIMTDNFWGS